MSKQSIALLIIVVISIIGAMALNPPEEVTVIDRHTAYANDIINAEKEMIIAEDKYYDAVTAFKSNPTFINEYKAYRAQGKLFDSVHDMNHAIFEHTRFIERYEVPLEKAGIVTHDELCQLMELYSDAIGKKYKAKAALG